MIQKIKQHTINAMGWRTNRKIVVFESDDWGAIRMPSKRVYNNLLRAGIGVDKSKYDILDSLERKEDLEALFGVLKLHRNQRNKSPMFTFNTVMGNPDFQAIKNEGFKRFVFEDFFSSYQYYYQENLKEVWQKAIVEQLIKPQFHAREHLNTNLWMRDLHDENSQTRRAFNNHFYGLKTHTSSKNQRHYLAACYYESEDELKAGRQIVEDGLNLFEKAFGFKSESFIGCNFVWPDELEIALKNCGVKYLQGQRGHIVPSLYGKRSKVRYHYTGQSNAFGQLYSVRNVTFEPYLNQGMDWVAKALQDIRSAFWWKKPAIISSHRINYVSNMDVKNRDESLGKLNLLLTKIIAKWPEVEFLSSDELGRAMAGE